MILLLSLLVTASALLVGCKEGSEGSISKVEEDAMRKPLGQPMPPEAKAAMEKAMRANTGGPPPANCRR